MKLLYAMIFAAMPLMAQALPKDLAAQVARDPEGVLDDVSVFIAGYGQNGAIDRQGLQNFISMERADARAMATRRLQGADLDGDGAIGGDEMRIKAAASASAARGRLILYFGKADMDRDDQVSVDELQAYANLVALQEVSEEKAAKAYAVLGFDLNGDNWVTLDEAKAALTGKASAKPRDKIDQKFKI